MQNLRKLAGQEQGGETTPKEASLLDGDWDVKASVYVRFGCGPSIAFKDLSFHVCHVLLLRARDLEVPFKDLQRRGNGSCN